MQNILLDDEKLKDLKGRLQTAKILNLRVLGIEPATLGMLLLDLNEYQEELKSVSRELKELQEDYADIVSERREILDQLEKRNILIDLPE